MFQIGNFSVNEFFLFQKAIFLGGKFVTIFEFLDGWGNNALFAEIVRFITGLRDVVEESIDANFPHMFLVEFVSVIFPLLANRFRSLGGAGIKRRVVAVGVAMMAERCRLTTEVELVAELIA